MKRFTWVILVVAVMVLTLTCGDPQGPLELQPPTASVLTATPQAEGDPAITLAWSPCPDDDFAWYTVFRSDSPGIEENPSSADTSFIVPEATFTSWIDESIGGEETWYYAIRTTDTEDLASWSNEAVATTPPVIPTLTLYFINPGYGSLSGDATLIRTPGNHWYLIDGGDRNSSWSCGEDRILPMLDSLGVQELDGIVGTHPHADHIGGLIAVLEAMPVGTVWDSGYEYTTQTYQDYIDAIWDNGADYVMPRRGDMLNWDDQITVECIHPVDPVLGRGDDVNNASITLLITFQEVSFLFTGDLETDEGEEVILAALNLGYIETIAANVLKVGHHGSSTSTSQAWLDAVQPSIAAIEVGAGNPYGHPHDEVINRLQSFGADIYRTDLDGTFIITTDGSTLEVYP